MSQASHLFRPLGPLALLALLCPVPDAQDRALRTSLELGARGEPTSTLVFVDGGLETAVRSTPNRILSPAIRAVPGSPALGLTWTEVDPDGDAVPYQAVSLDGSGFHQVEPVAYELELRHGRTDPLDGPERVFGPLQAGQENRLYVVQYWTQGIEPYRASLRALGARIHLFLPNNSNVVTMDRRTQARVRRLPFVRWVGRFHPAYKLEEELLFEEIQGPPAQPVLRVNILTMQRGPEGHEPVLARIRELGGFVDEDSPSTNLISATMGRGGVAELARMDEVQWIDRWMPPDVDMNIARGFHGADYVEFVAGYTGLGVRVEVMDGGCDEIHGDLQNFIVHGLNTTSDHGTCTAGIVCGSGAGGPAATGAMPDSLLVIADFEFPFSGGSRYAHTGELQDPLDAYRVVLQSNSWGNGLTTSYTSISQDMDLILFDHDRISILQSQSNTGDQFSRPQAWAKNIIAVGGIIHFNTSSKSDDRWAGGASIGPAADGRIKPDLASFYDNIQCPDQVGPAGYALGDYFSGFGGTSGATPIVAGHMGLLYQMWADGIFGNPTPGADVFENRPYNTTAKALLINTAFQWTFSGAGADLTRTHQGWGHPRLQTAWDSRARMLIVDETDVLSELDSTEYIVRVLSGTPEFKATMVYRDRPGTTSSSQHRINDLDLRVTAPGGVVYWGNNGLLANMYSVAGGSPNTKDTVENVFVQNPTPGIWRVEVIASELNQDSHVETPGVDADYALVVHEVVGIREHYVHAPPLQGP